MFDWNTRRHINVDICCHIVILLNLFLCFQSEANSKKRLFFGSFMRICWACSWRFKQNKTKIVAVCFYLSDTRFYNQIFQSLGNSEGLRTNLGIKPRREAGWQRGHNKLVYTVHSLVYIDFQTFTTPPPSEQYWSGSGTGWVTVATYCCWQPF